MQPRLASTTARGPRTGCAPSADCCARAASSASAGAGSRWAPLSPPAHPSPQPPPADRAPGGPPSPGGPTNPPAATTPDPGSQRSPDPAGAHRITSGRRIQTEPSKPRPSRSDHRRPTFQYRKSIEKRAVADRKPAGRRPPEPRFWEQTVRHGTVAARPVTDLPTGRIKARPIPATTGCEQARATAIGRPLPQRAIAPSGPHPLPKMHRRSGFSGPTSGRDPPRGYLTRHNKRRTAAGNRVKTFRPVIASRRFGGRRRGNAPSSFLHPIRT